MQKKYTYYFYHHFAMGDDREKVKDLIDTNDYDGFLKLKAKYENKKYNPNGWLFLPDMLWDDENEKSVLLTRKTFAEINYCESECG